MIKLLGKNDEETALVLLDREHATNLILISDIVEYGMENQGRIFDGDYFGAFEQGELHGVAALFNFGSLFLYAPHRTAAEELAGHLAGRGARPRYYVSRSEGAGPFLQEMERQGIKPSKLESQECLALSLEGLRPRPAPAARFARPDDLAAIMQLQHAFQVEYFRATSDLEEEFAGMAIGRMAGGGIVVAEEAGEVVAKVEIMVRTPRMGQIGGVYTRPEHRGSGLAGACMSLLCERLLKDYEAAVLTVAVSNEAARRLYYGLGFVHICDSIMAVFA
jgi:ribosomal protein S18 acetylase RimI-like enzyme